MIDAARADLQVGDRLYVYIARCKAGNIADWVDKPSSFMLVLDADSLM